MKAAEYIFKNEEPDDFSLAAFEERMTIIQGIRIFFLAAILFLTIVFQSIQPEFLNPEVWVPIYVILGISFLLNGLFLYAFKNLTHHWIANSIAFGYDAVVITSLIYFTGISQSVFLFMYLVYIVLCGLAYRRKGAIIMALWTSSLFSILMVLGPSLEGRSLYFAIAINNLAFLSVAVLSGILSEQFDFIGVELKERGRELASLKDFNQLIVENVGSGFLTVDPDFLISHCNNSATRILDDHMLVGKHLKEIFPSLHKRIVSLGEVDEPIRFEERYKNYREEQLIIESIVSLLEDSEQNSLGYVVMFQDLTEFKRLEFNMRQQEKMAAVGQLAAGIAHEIRNPLASISGSIQMLSTPDFSEDESQRLMRIVVREIDRLNNLINDFLEFVRPDKMKEEPLNLVGLMQEILEMVKLNQKLPQDVKQTFTRSTDRRILGDEDKLKQALLNIVINGYQAMEQVEEKELKVDCSESSGEFVLKIQDKGMGMDENNIRRLFEPFHTTKSKGTGLGLAITHKILENHQANVFVESAVGEGTTFIIKFQLADDDNPGNEAKISQVS
ncbi:MAG: PAS domain-containing sensor histidine kinase [Bdellovibrionaceae bacterium]|nr:PAS domain-containing sensor histidine kinase [Pseudobdellovibrionaceae bacterium]|tara:strand:- start:32423 stop:34096 length:1674 start_codon:yes stop_codon:yes gene_type:complete